MLQCNGRRTRPSFRLIPFGELCSNSSSSSNNNRKVWERPHHHLSSRLTTTTLNIVHCRTMCTSTWAELSWAKHCICVCVRVRALRSRPREEGTRRRRGGRTLCRRLLYSDAQRSPKDKRPWPWSQLSTAALFSSWTPFFFYSSNNQKKKKKKKNRLKQTATEQ